MGLSRLTLLEHQKNKVHLSTTVMISIFSYQLSTYLTLIM